MAVWLKFHVLCVLFTLLTRPQPLKFVLSVLVLIVLLVSLLFIFQLLYYYILLNCWLLLHYQCLLNHDGPIFWYSLSWSLGAIGYGKINNELDGNLPQRKTCSFTRWNNHKKKPLNLKKKNLYFHTNWFFTHLSHIRKVTLCAPGLTPVDKTFPAVVALAFLAKCGSPHRKAC